MSITVVGLRVTFREVVSSMKRVTAIKPYESLLGLKVLASFLNFDWESGNSKNLEKLKSDARKLFWIIIQNALKDRDKAEAVQAELKSDLVPIFAAEGKVTPEEADHRIKRLIRKLNEVESKIEWEIGPIDYERTSTVDPQGEPLDDMVLRPLDPDEIEPNWVFMDVSAELNLLGYRWRFGSSFKGRGWDRFRPEALYQMIREALKSGAIERFRTCPHCKAFFVADDARQQFCSDDHRNEFNNSKRLQSGYFSDLRRKKRTADLKRARALKREGKSPTEIQKQTGLSLRVLKRERLLK